jgi:hypothetical protein
MKPNRLLSFSIAAIILLTGCVHNKGLKASKIAGRDARVVPVRSQPIIVINENLALVAVGTLVGGLGGAIAATAANQGATADKRATLTGRLNDDGSAFNPERILAEECLKLLQASSRVKFQSLTLHSEPLDLPGRAELIRDETQPFKAKDSKAFDWHMRARDWLKTPPAPEYAQAISQGQPVVTVEALFPSVLLINANTFEMAVAIRVVDSAQGRIIGSRYSMVRKKIRPISADSDFDFFVADFRSCASEASRECLKQLNLL